MKKLRMIVTSAIVLAIVGSAFAFNAKKGATFCVSTALTDNHCTTFLVTGMKITTGANNFLYFMNWDGDKTKCVTTSTQCQTGIHIAND
jgi:hypothetical protein